jgi:hypothetical protein
MFAVAIGIFAYFIRNRIVRKEMTLGPNKILLLPDDLIFVAPKSSIFQSRVNLLRKFLRFFF